MEKRKAFRTYFKSLKFKILLLVILVGMVPAFVITGGFFKIYEQRSVDTDEREMAGQLQQINNQIVTSGYINNLDSDGVNDQLNALTRAYSGRIMVIDTSLKIIKDTYGVDEGKTIIWKNVVQSAKGETVSYYDKENCFLTVSVPIIETNGETQKIVGVLLVNKSMDYIQQNEEYFQSVAILALLVISIASIVLALVFSKKFTAPFRKMSKSIDEIQTGFGDDELSINDFSETSEISEKFNGLLVRMKVIDDSRQEFVSNVSHELKTPLTSMKVLADSLNSMGEAPIELYQEFMTDIGDEIDRETKIINDLLSLVKMDKSGVSLNISPVNLNELMELILKRLKPIAEKQHVELVLESFRPVTAEIDEVKLTLAISNLVENGIKYNNEGGWVHVSINSDHQYCYIKVEDSGMGIPQDSLDHIFERFYRVDKSHSREIGGTGLGLAITRNAILMHRGAIKVHSTEGEGTVFDVRIPLNYIAKEG